MTVLVDHIKTYLADAGREDSLFLTTRGTHPLRGNFGRDVLKAGAELAALGDRHITWLTLRHTAAASHVEVWAWESDRCLHDGTLRQRRLHLTALRAASQKRPRIGQDASRAMW